MSTFGGRIEELENILVDNFSNYKAHTCFFLSHCHSDHMNGIDKILSSANECNHKVYCSSISRLILLNKYKFASENVIQELTSPQVISVPGNDTAPTYQVTVTPIPAGHCPGSIMFLFETVNHTTLYTGDFRISRGDVTKFKPFHSKNQIKLIDKLYFDSTFLNEIYWDFPSRIEVVSELVSLIEHWTQKSLNHNVLLVTSALIGYETVFIEVAKKLKCKVHVKDLMHDFYLNVPEIGCYLTKDCRSTKVHASGPFDRNCLRLDEEQLLRIKLSAQWYQSAKGKAQQPFWKHVSNQNVLMCYSTHCSCSELVDFLNYLKPKSIQSCATAVGSTKKDTEEFIQRLIHSWQTRESLNSEPDTKMLDLPLKKNYKFELKFPH